MFFKGSLIYQKQIPSTLQLLKAKLIYGEEVEEHKSHFEFEDIPTVLPEEL